MIKLCSITGCDAVHNARGYCLKHYRRVVRHGDPHFCSEKPMPSGNEGKLNPQRPLKGRCSICQEKVSGGVTEMRYDPDVDLYQAWPYCNSCWAEMVRLREAPIKSSLWRSLLGDVMTAGEGGRRSGVRGF